MAEVPPRVWSVAGSYFEVCNCEAICPWAARPAPPCAISRLAVGGALAGIGVLAIWFPWLLLGLHVSGMHAMAAT